MVDQYQCRESLRMCTTSTFLTSTLEMSIDVCDRSKQTHSLGHVTLIVLGLRTSESAAISTSGGSANLKGCCEIDFLCDIRLCMS